MKIEHFAINVDQPETMARWYEEHMGLEIVLREESPPYKHFLADSGGQVMLEIYKNPPDEVPDYGNMNPLIMHLAFVSEDPSADKDRLIQAGAHLENEEFLDDGTHLVMLRDPWEVPIQLCKRGIPLGGPA